MFVVLTAPEVFIHSKKWNWYIAMPNFYKIEINRTEWEVPDRYQMLTPVGSGAYGQVW